MFHILVILFSLMQLVQAEEAFSIGKIFKDKLNDGNFKL